MYCYLGPSVLVDDVSDVNFFDQTAARLFSLARNSGKKELWQLLPQPRRLVDLDFGLTRIATDPTGTRAITQYSMGQTYLLDLDWLRTLHDAGEQITPEQLTELACTKLFAAQPIDAATLAPYLNGEAPRACQ